jgi:endo-1,4-beta-xylanase
MAGTSDSDEIIWVNAFTSDLPGLKHETFHCASMPRLVGYGIYLPPEYKNSNTGFPVIYWLHGLDGNESSGVDAGVPIVLHQAIETKQIPPMMMVLVNGANFSMYGDSFDNSIMAKTAFIKELVPHIDNTYRTIPTREGRAIEGFSMGGYGAIKLACEYPEMFSSVVSYAGALHTMESLSSKRPHIFARMFNADPNVFKKHSLHEWAKRNVDAIRENISIRIVVGTDDVTLSYHQSFWLFLDELRVPYESQVLDGYSHSSQLYYSSEGIAGFAFHVRNMKFK